MQNYTDRCANFNDVVKKLGNLFAGPVKRHG